MMSGIAPLFVLYVQDQTRARDFYRAVLQMKPSLDVPGMTEFYLNDQARLGLMPVAGIKRLLGEALPDPQSASGIPRAELYLMVTDPRESLQRALAHDAKLLSEVSPRDWGDTVGYCLDLDSHVLAFARKTR